MQRKDGGCCPRCPSDIEPSPPYDELSHEVADNVLSVKVAKTAGRIKPVSGMGDADGSDAPSVTASCESASGNRCRVSCAKVNVIPNTPAPPKLPDEEMLVLRTSRKILNSDDMRNTLEIELRTPRNYEPLAEPPEPVVESVDDVEEKGEVKVESKSGEGESAKNGKKKKVKID